jgi:transposase
MEDRETWAKRVEEWRASGLTAEKFCVERELSARRLYEWSSRLRKAEGRGPKNGIPVARLIRRRAWAQGAAGIASQGVVAITIELGAARVTVMPGVDRGTLATVLGALEASARGGGR